MSHTTALRINTRKCTARSVYRMMYRTVHCKLYMNDLCLNNGKFQDSLWVNGRCINERVLITVSYPPIFCKHSLFVSFASLLVHCAVHIVHCYIVSLCTVCVYTGILFPYVLYVCILFPYVCVYTVILFPYVCVYNGILFPYVRVYTVILFPYVCVYTGILFPYVRVYTVILFPYVCVYCYMQDICLF